MAHRVEDRMLLIPQLYPDIYTQVVSEQGPKAAKPSRRRRRKSKGGEAGSGVARKRKLSEEQVTLLEISFGNEHKLESERKDRLASELGLDPRQVAVWFQNRRARWKNKKMEEEYSKLKASHDGVVVENRRLEAEVLKLKEQLSEAEKEIRQLSARAECGVSGNSSSSSFSMEAVDPGFIGPFGVEGLERMFYVPPASNYDQGVDSWDNLFNL